MFFRLFILNRLNARDTLRSGLSASGGAIVYNGGSTSNPLGSGFKFNLAIRSRANTADIAVSNKSAATIAIEMSNVASNNNNSDSYTKVRT